MDENMEPSFYWRPGSSGGPDNAHQLQCGEVLMFGLSSEESSSSDYTPLTSSSDGTSSESDHQSPPRESSTPSSPDQGEPIRDTSQSEITVAIPTLLHERKNFLIEMPPGSNRKSKVFREIVKYLNWTRNQVGSNYPEAFNLDRSSGPAISKIIVATRSFDESKRFLAELRLELGDTQLLTNLSLTALGPRKEYCINEDLVGVGLNPDQAEVDHQCRSLIAPINENIPSSSKKSRNEDNICPYYPRSAIEGPEFLVEGFLQGHHVEDIEDYVDNCRQANLCPYFVTLESSKTADIIVLPLKYIVCPVFQEEYQISLENSIIYIDDGFDLEKICRDLSSLNISMQELSKSIRLARQILDRSQAQNHDGIGLDTVIDVCSNLVKALVKFRDHYEDNEEENDDRNDQTMVMEILEPLLYADHLGSKPILNRIREYSESQSLQISPDDSSNLEIFKKLVVILNLLAKNPASYTVQMSSKRLSTQQPLKKTTFLEIICANQSLLLTSIATPASSLIVGSNCIAPYKSFSQEFLGTHFHEILKPPQDLPLRNRVLLTYTSNGGDPEVKLDLTFKGRKKPDVKRELGLALVNLCKSIKYGKLAVFHSEVYMGELIRFWGKEETEEGTILSQLRDICTVINELELSPDEIPGKIEEFGRLARSSLEGALLLCFVRGNLYKNWETKAYQSCRGVIHVSIPFGSWDVDNYIDAKRAYFLKRYRAEGKEMNREWYWRDAFRQINLSFGCLAKNSTDGGVVVILDSRMYPARHEFDDLLPEFCREKNKREEDPEHCENIWELVRRVENHFEGMEME